MSEKIGLKMAKPDAGDLRMAKDLARAFNQISDGFMPTLNDNEPDRPLGFHTWNTQDAFDRLCEIAQRGSLDRVVWTLDMLLNPKNAVVDPDSNHVELHPRFAVADDMLAVLVAYEQWEADIIIDGDWSHSIPRMTADQFERMLEIQTMRNAAVKKAKGATPNEIR